MVSTDSYGNYVADMGPQPTNPAPASGFIIIVAGNPTTLGTTAPAGSFAFDSVGLTYYYTANGTTWTAVSGGSGGTTETFSGSGSPEGVVAAVPGNTYLDTDSGSLWLKLTGSGTTGWYQRIA